MARDLAQLMSAANVLGQTLVFGSELSFELQALAQNPEPPFHATGKPWTQQSFVLLQGMLVAERWLIEFLLGPALEKGHKRETDICVDCFHHDWRFPESQVANELAARRIRINKLVLHPTWELVEAGPRNWTLTRIEHCVWGLGIFADGVEEAWPDVAKVLKRHVSCAKAVLSSGRADGSRWFDLGPLQASDAKTTVQSSPDVAAAQQGAGSGGG